MWLRLALGFSFLGFALMLFFYQEDKTLIPVPGESPVLLVLPPVLTPSGQRGYLLGKSDCNGQPPVDTWPLQPMPALHADCILILPGKSQIPVLLVIPEQSPQPMVLHAELMPSQRYTLRWPDGSPVKIQAGPKPVRRSAPTKLNAQ
jgi:hypothetical protein